MQFNLEANGETLVASLSGQLDFTSTAGFEQLLRELREISPRQLVLDISEVTWLDSVGLGQLFLLHEAMRIPQITLRDPRPSVRELLALTKADTVFAIA